MSLIKNQRVYKTLSKRPKEALVLCGFGGSIWQTRRLAKVLQVEGYNVTALDFPKEVLSKGDVTLLPRLVDEVVAFAENKAKETGRPILLIGISLGALLTLNILRRSKLFSEGVLITGGDIVKVAHSLYGRKVWHQSYAELANAWRSINMYTDPKELAGKRLLFILPTKDRLVDINDIHNEVRRQNIAGNHLALIPRQTFGHIGTIIEESILFPGRVLGYIEHLKRS